MLLLTKPVSTNPEGKVDSTQSGNHLMQTSMALVLASGILINYNLEVWWCIAASDLQVCHNLRSLGNGFIEVKRAAIVQVTVFQRAN